MPPAPTGTIVIGRSAIFLRGFDQASKVPKSALYVGNKLLVRHDVGNKYDPRAVSVSNLAGKHIGRVAKEFSPGCYHLLQFLESSSTLCLVSTFTSFDTEHERYYEQTLVHIDLHYFARCDYAADEASLRRAQE